MTSKRILALGLVGCLAGCTGEESVAADTDILPVEEIDVPSEEEAAAAAESAITDENAEEYLERLEQEIGGS